MRTFNSDFRASVPLFLALAVATGASAQQFKWETNLDTARKLAAKSGKPVLVDFFATWCGPCRLMDEETFSAPEVRALMRKAICVRLDLDKHERTAVEFGVESIPRILMLPAAGGPPMMDIRGYRDAGDFTAELRRALGLKQGEVVLTGTESASLTRVRQSLQSNAYASLRALQPQVAAEGLNDLVAALGVSKESELPPLIGLLRNAGGEAIPALIRGMNHRHLAVRAGAYRALQTLLRERKLEGGPSYDPWAAAAARQNQLQRWTAWWQARKGGF